MFSGDSIYIVISERKNLAYSFLVKIVIMHILWINTLGHVLVRFCEILCTAKGKNIVACIC